MGKIHVYCGEGKGKTTASVGLSVRALGNGFNVIFSQFLKSTPTGELESFAKLPNVEVIRSTKPLKFTFLMNDEEKEECKEINNNIFKEVISRPINETTLIVFDELVGTMAKNLIDKKMVLDFLESEPKCEVVLTGREPCCELLELADYVTEMTKHKHPFDKGVASREGIEF